MAKPYSYDLRQKVIQAITLDGLNKTEASQLGSGKYVVNHRRKA